MSHVVACFSFPALASGGSGSHELLCSAALRTQCTSAVSLPLGLFSFLSIFFMNLICFFLIYMPFQSVRWSIWKMSFV